MDKNWPTEFLWQSYPSLVSASILQTKNVKSMDDANLIAIYMWLLTRSVEQTWILSVEFLFWNSAKNTQI